MLHTLFRFETVQLRAKFKIWLMPCFKFHKDYKFQFFFLSGFSFAENSRIIGQLGKWEANSNFSLPLPSAPQKLRH